MNSTTLPTPWAVVQKIVYMMFNEVADRTLWEHIYASVYRMVIGLVIGITLGVPFGIFMGWNRYFESAAKPLFETFRMISIPVMDSSIFRLFSLALARWERYLSSSSLPSRQRC